MTQPGVSAITALAFVVTIGEVARVGHGNQAAICVGDSSDTVGRQRRLARSANGATISCAVLVEAAQTVVRLGGGCARVSTPLPYKAREVTKVAAAHKLAVQLYWMLRSNTAYPEIVHNESSSRCPWPAQARPRI